MLVTASADHIARIFPIVDGFAETARVSSPGAMRAVAVSSDSKFLAAGDEIGFATVHPIGGSGARVKIPFGGQVAALAFGPPSGNLLAAASPDGGIRVVRVSDGAEMAHFPGIDQAVTVAFSPNGRFIAGGGLGGVAELAATSDWKTVRRFVLRPDRAGVENANPAQTGLSSPASAPGTVASVPEEQVFSLAFSPDSSTLAIGSVVLPDDGMIRLVALDSLKDRVSVRLRDWVQTIAFSGDGQRVAAGGTKGAWGLSTAGAETPTELASAAAPVALSTDGQLLAVAEIGTEVAQTVGIYLSGSLKREMQIINGGAVVAVAFSPDGTLLASASSDGTTKLVSARTGAEEIRLSHERAATAIAFSPDSRFVVTASEDGTARLWSTDFDVILKRLCAGPGRNITLSEWRRFIGDVDWQPTCPEWPIPDDVRAAGLAR
jgi:WD40 repeat protein